jgi:recombination protein RecT
MATKQLPPMRIGAGATPPPAAEPPPDSFLAKLERSRDEFAKLLPDEKAVDRFLRVARTAYQMDPKVRACTPLSVLSCVMKACELGLEPGGALKQAYLIPYRPKGADVAECTLQLSYFGVLELARRSGAFRAIEARVVRQGDEFAISYDPEPVFRHVPRLDTDAELPITHAYAYARLTNGALVLEVMGGAEIDRVRSVAKCGNVWDNHWGEMAKKTAIKRLLKRQPCSPAVAEAIAHDNQGYDLGDVTPGRAAIAPGRTRMQALGDKHGAPEPEFSAEEGVARPSYTEDAPAEDPGDFDETTEPVDRSEGS